MVLKFLLIVYDLIPCLFDSILIAGVWRCMLIHVFLPAVDGASEKQAQAEEN